eukprot:TRINITY_DN28513_c0_g1_i1.p1 TRINITY_DN28513_c0_g1~~TRINITY_DN28513_c0_g1_i1.p1  ORF type:complete len:636 (+),score=96.12 TRINITY_DN28513_c0_g1_i1:64-1908(+)
MLRKLVTLSLTLSAWSITTTLPDGQIKGIVVNGTEMYRGIPYAQPPLGNLRFREPVEIQPWHGVKDATNFGASCTQPGSPGTGQSPGWKSINVTDSSEDCLFVNVFRPLNKTNLPVMVYLHAGEFVYGSSNDEENNFPYLSKNIVLVTANSRLGITGFGALTEFAKESNGSTGNYGMLDQRMVLKWIQKSIKSLGGDPTRVTIFGESSGGTSVSFHVTSSESKKYFQRAILESPGVTQSKTLTDARINTEYIITSLAHYYSPGCTLASPVQYQHFPTRTLYTNQSSLINGTVDEVKANCTSDPQCPGILYNNDLKGGFKVASPYPFSYRTYSYVDLYLKWGDVGTAGATCLRSASMDSLTKLAEDVPYSDTIKTDRWAPVIDGTNLNASITELVRDDGISDVDILSGSNKDEGTIFMELVPRIECNATYEDFEKWAVSLYGEDLGSQIPPMYLTIDQPVPKCRGGTEGNGTWYMSAMRSTGDWTILCRSKMIVEKALKPAYQYYFVLEPVYSMNYDNLDDLGAFHGSEVPFVFGDPWELSNKGERQLSSAMGCYWANFAETGNPNNGSCSGYPYWPPFGASQSYIEFSATNETSVISAKAQLHKEACDVFSKYP